MKTNRRNVLKLMGMGAVGLAFAPFVKASEATLSSLPRNPQTHRVCLSQSITSLWCMKVPM